MKEQRTVMSATTHRIFRTSLRVPYAHIDQMGFVYYANYFVYFEMARSDMLREAGIPYPELEKRGVLLPVVEAVCQYRKPAYYDDLLTVQTQVMDIEGTRLRIAYEIRRTKCGTAEQGEKNDVVCTGHTLHVCLSREGKVLRPAPELVELARESVSA